MDRNSLEQILKQQTDAINLELEAYRRGYLQALSFIASKLSELENPVNTDVDVNTNAPTDTAAAR